MLKYKYYMGRPRLLVSVSIDDYSTWRAVRFQESLHQELKERKKLLEAPAPQERHPSNARSNAPNPASPPPNASGRLYGVSELDPYINTSLEGQDLVSVGGAFGESFLYYSAVNPSTRRLERKVTFVKRVVVYGLPILVGSGYYHPDEGP